MRLALALLLALSTSPAAMLLAQRPDSLAEEVRKYVVAGHRRRGADPRAR